MNVSCLSFGKTTPILVRCGKNDTPPSRYLPYEVDISASDTLDGDAGIPELYFVETRIELVGFFK